MCMCRADIMAVTNRRLCGRPFLEQIERICALRPAAVILREKDLTPEEYGRLGAQVLEVCRAWGVDLYLPQLCGGSQKGRGAGGFICPWLGLRRW